MDFTLHALGCYSLICTYMCVFIFMLKPERDAVYLNILFLVYPHQCVFLCKYLSRTGLEATQSDLVW